MCPCFKTNLSWSSFTTHLVIKGLNINDQRYDFWEFYFEDIESN